MDVIFLFLRLNEKDFFHCQYLLECTFYEQKFGLISPSLLACSVMYLSNKLNHREKSWNCELTRQFGFAEKQVRSVAKEVCSWWEETRTNQQQQQQGILTGVIRKFSDARYKHVAF